MGKLSWYINRLRAMNVPEVYWRLKQKQLQNKEASWAKSHMADVSEKLIDKDLAGRYSEVVGTMVNPDSLPFQKPELIEIYGENTDDSIHLLGGYDYKKYKTRWHAGFNTENDWPLTQSYALEYKQCDAIGDARLNWELNRGFQFVLLARRGDIQELDVLLDSWCKQNPWLMGISWTSVMEVAIRAMQWTTAAYYLSLLEPNKQIENIKRRLENGALNMTEYVSLHYSRYSSANNHLLVEALCLVYVGSAFGIEEWHNLGLRLLDEELPKQNYIDGVNKEMALHYQTFAMEAYALAIIVSSKLSGKVPDNWKNMLRSQCDFVAWSISGDKPMEWGDNDEGKIIDLSGGAAHKDHYRYVLNLYKLLDIYDGDDKKAGVGHFKDGGYTFAKSSDGKVMLGMDHAPLGFGNIAAHGHADALSIQLIVDGVDILSDPGTYVYHCNLPMRNELRRTINHNTICVGEREQSEMLGAFLWGKKAETKVDEIDFDEQSGDLHIKASHNGYNPIIHSRTLDFTNGRNITVADNLSEKCDFTLTYILGSKVEARISEENIIQLYVDDRLIGDMTLIADNAQIAIEKTMLSYDYGVLTPSHAIRLRTNGNHVKTKINLI